MPSFSDFAQKYLHEIDGLKRPKTVELEELHLKHLNEFLGKLKLDKISKQHVVRFRKVKIKGGWTGRTVNLSITIVNNLFNHAKDNGLINMGPTTGAMAMPIYFHHPECLMNMLQFVVSIRRFIRLVATGTLKFGRLQTH